MKPVFDNDGLATNAGDIRCYYFNPVTGEYTGWSDEFINVGVSMPGNSTEIDPGDVSSGEVAVFTNDGWMKEADYRGTTVYSTKDGTTSTINYIGEIKGGYTVKAPGTLYDKWDGSEWLTDTDAKHAADVADAEAKQSVLRSVADNEIEWRQDAIDAGIATEEEAAALAEWKKYRVLLMRVDTAAPEWPTPPATQAS